MSETKRSPTLSALAAFEPSFSDGDIPDWGEGVYSAVARECVEQEGASGLPTTVLCAHCNSYILLFQAKMSGLRAATPPPGVKATGDVQAPPNRALEQERGCGHGGGYETVVTIADLHVNPLARTLVSKLVHM